MTNNRREFLKSAAASIATVTLFRNAKGEIVSIGDGDGEAFPELIEVTIAELQAQMKSGKLTSVKLTEMYLERITLIDTKTHSVLEVNPDALAIAAGLDKERKKGKIRSMLHGIPVLIKDNIDTADKMLTTAGSLALVDAPTPKQDAFVVQQLRKAGAVIIGKTNLSEWANFRGQRSISGWSGRGGQTNNPYWLDQNPLGSSSGSGVAVSANLTAVAIGTETSGSIISPAVTNGVVGLKPTVGLVSRSGIIPISHSQDTAGPMTRSVADAAIVLSAIAGTDKNDPATIEADKRKAKDYTKFLDRDGLKGARLGLLTSPPPQRNLDAWKAYWEPFFEKLRQAGATVVDVKFPDISQTFGADRMALMQFEFKANLNKYLADRGGKYKTLEDLIKFNLENKDKELSKFGQELFIESQARADLTDKSYLDAVARLHKQTREDGIDTVLTQNKLDALVGPFSELVGVAAIAGYPSILVPLGLRDMPAVPASGNLPASPALTRTTGMLFVGTAWSETKLIRYAYAFEQMTKGRVTPQFLPTFPKK